MKIQNKREFFTLWEQERLGNRTLLWHSVDDAYASGVPMIGFRQLNTAKGAKGAWCLVPRDQAHATAQEWSARGYTFMMDGAVPNLSAILQGEMVRTEKGLEGYFCERATMTVADLETLAKNGYPTGLPPMRWTMAAGYHQPMGYLQTMMALRRCLDPASFEDVMLLLQWYPEAAIELAAFSCPVGVLPRRNTIIWEVRDY